MVVELPSINNAGQFIDVNDMEYTDYIHYNLVNGELIRTVYKRDFGASDREIGSMTVARGMESITFRAHDPDNPLNVDGELLGEVPLGEFSKRDILIVLMSAEIADTQGGNAVTKTLRMRARMRNMNKTLFD